jgi:hypothetical protein
MDTIGGFCVITLEYIDLYRLLPGTKYFVDIIIKHFTI